MASMTLSITKVQTGSTIIEHIYIVLLVLAISFSVEQANLMVLCAFLNSF